MKRQHEPIREVEGTRAERVLVLSHGAAEVTAGVMPTVLAILDANPDAAPDQDAWDHMLSGMLEYLVAQRNKQGPYASS